MRGYAHDGTRAVVHEDIVRHPYGNFLAIVGIEGEVPGVDPVLFDLSDIAHFFGFALLGDHVRDLVAQLRIGGSEAHYQRMLRSKLD